MTSIEAANVVVKDFDLFERAIVARALQCVTSVVQPSQNEFEGSRFEVEINDRAYIADIQSLITADDEVREVVAAVSDNDTGVWDAGLYVKIISVGRYDHEKIAWQVLQEIGINKEAKDFEVVNW